jgi:diguanylate cyclase (GGDEF)-like protein
VLAALFLLLYAYRRKPYILQWVMSWLLFAVSLALLVVEPSGRSLARSLLGLSSFFTIAAVLLFVMAADTFQRRERPSRRYLIGLLPLLIWFTLAPIVLGPRAALIPGYLATAAALATGALAYLGVLRRTWLLGAGVVGMTLLLLAGTHGWAAFSMARTSNAQVVFGLMLLHGVLYLFAALGMHILVFEDMTYELRLANRHLQEAQDELHEKMITDPLTGCYNRRFFDETIGAELQRHERYSIPLSLLFVDVDHFKAVNDSFGHEAGDRLLRNVAVFLHEHVREADHVFRWGGDEFLVLISCPLEAARHKGIELKKAFQAAVDTSELPRGVGLSVGCSEVVANTDDIMERVHEADRRMYQDKVATR